MLPEILVNNTFYSKSHPDVLEWQLYLSKIGGFSHIIDIEFLSQICFEHSDRFNYYFPLFNFEQHNVIRITKTTKEIYDCVRYDDNNELSFWYSIIDDFFEHGKTSYEVLDFVIKHGTWSFAPVIIEHDFANKIGNGSFGKPFHLIEGTHRVSFINRLYELNFIKGDTEHELLCIVER